jgi:hypothetical protein
MRISTIAVAAFAALAPVPASALIDVPPFEGNDTGGIIAFSPDAYRFRHDIAADHCARYRKIHRITSVHPRYGDYIAFACFWPRGSDGVILRRAY